MIWGKEEGGIIPAQGKQARRERVGACTRVRSQRQVHDGAGMDLVLVSEPA